MKQTVKIIVEERGKLWSKWRKIMEFEEEIDSSEICNTETMVEGVWGGKTLNHKWAYESLAKRKCKRCGRRELLVNSYFMPPSMMPREVWVEEL